jgi:hypothetical protein
MCHLFCGVFSRSQVFEKNRDTINVGNVLRNRIVQTGANLDVIDPGLSLVQIRNRIWLQRSVPERPFLGDNFFPLSDATHGDRRYARNDKTTNRESRMNLPRCVPVKYISVPPEKIGANFRQKLSNYVVQICLPIGRGLRGNCGVPILSITGAYRQGTPQGTEYFVST